MNKLLKVILAAGLVAFGSSASLLANSVVLPATGTWVTVVDMATNTPGTIVALQNDAFSSSDESGYVYAYAVTNWSLNPYGLDAYAFVYQVFSDQSSIDYITGFAVSGFLDFDTSVAYWDYNGGVLPESAKKLLSGTIDFDFSGSGVAPGSYSYQMIVFTNATSVTTGTAAVKDGSGATLITVIPAVPDGGITALLLGFGLLGAGWMARRRR